MLSHAMQVSLVPAVPGLPFTIGHEGGGRENDFVLNGVGEIETKSLLMLVLKKMVNSGDQS